MATEAVQNPPSANESKSSRKKKAKAATGGLTNGAEDSPTLTQATSQDEASLDSSQEHPYVKELAKQMRNTQKKLAGMQKTDAVIAENPNVSLDDLVAQRKINTDQKAAAQKKPQLQAQLATLEEQITQYRKFDSESQSMLSKQKEDLTAQHQKDVEKAKEELRQEGVTTTAADLKKKLLVLSQFLRAAAAKRSLEEEVDSDESKAFEGTLLLLYGGDEKAVETAEKLIEGSEEQVPSIEGVELPVKYAQVKQASIDHAPYQTEEQWVDSVAEANANVGETQAAEPAPVSDPTIANAGLTELDTSAPKTNGVPAEPAQDSVTSPPQGNAGDDAGNAAGDRWDATAAGAEKSTGTDDSFEMVPRPASEVDTPAPAITEQPKSTSWADDATAHEAATAAGATTSGNEAGEGWDTKAAGEQPTETITETPQPLSTEGWADSTAADTSATATPAAGAVQEDADGFHEVSGRHRGGRGGGGRGGRGRGGDGEFRGRGRWRGGFRGGDGEFRGGRGRGGFRGRGEGGEGRGRGGGRGRGPRGDSAPVVTSS